MSPLVDRELLALWRASSLSEREYRQEVLAEWVDEAGAYFPSAELEAVVADYELLPPARAQRDMVVARGRLRVRAGRQRCGAARRVWTMAGSTTSCTRSRRGVLRPVARGALRDAVQPVR
ncbi:MAG: hypothetical protein WKG07_40600 [Hymenobacter sp.]